MWCSLLILTMASYVMIDGFSSSPPPPFTPLRLLSEPPPTFPSPVVGSSFASRGEIQASINMCNFTSSAARMTTGGGGGGRSFTVRCKCSSCTIFYTCRKREGRWWVDSIIGSHISCTPTSSVALPLRLVAQLPGVRALLNLQEHALGGKSVPVKALIRAATADHVTITPFQATRLKLEHTIQIEKRDEEDCRAVGFFCREICAKNPGTMSFLRCFDTDSRKVLWMTCASSPLDGVVDGVVDAVVEMSGTLSFRRPGATRGHLNLISMFFIPSYARAIFEARSTTSAADFARLFHKHGVYAKTQVFLWNTEFCGTTLSLLFGQYLGNEDSEMWDYVLGVSVT